MATKTSKKTTTNPKNAAKPTSQRRTTLKLEPSTANTKRINPLTAFVNLSQSQREVSSTPPPSARAKGKAKEVVRDVSPMGELNSEESGQLWVDLYEPQTEEELVVHIKKVADVRNWLREAFDGKLQKYRRILVLTGPAGTAKSSTIKVLGKEMNLDILEWRNSMGDSFTNAQASSSSWTPDDSMFTKFQLFLERASKCQNIFSASNTKKRPSSTTSNSTSSINRSSPAARLILLEDLPNILHASTRAQFHEVIRSLINDLDNPVPIVIVLSDSGARGEAGDERLAAGAWGRDQDGAVDIRNLLPKDILKGPFVTEIRYNPVAPTLMKKALQELLRRQFRSQKSPVTGQMLDFVVNSSNGDIRSAIMALQFACVRLSKKTKSADSQVLMESVTRREQSLFLFHLMGKIFYNKRKGDPPTAHASARDIKKDREIDESLTDPPKLPPHLRDHDRRASRVDVNTIYGDSPIDSSLFSLYIHQNYAQFSTDVDHCDGIADWLSWADSSGGEAWYQANPHRFHLLALGTLHSLPTPVLRQGQKVFKPDFFDNLDKEKEAWEGVKDVRSWIVDQGSESGWNLGAWTPIAIATELGGVLRAQDRKRTSLTSTGSSSVIPRSHRSFSSLKFDFENHYLSRSDVALRAAGRERLDEGDVDSGEPYSDSGIVIEEQQEMGMWQGDTGRSAGEAQDELGVVNAATGGWLENDDIEDF
ncbi:Rad17 cell cycle checkpoint protein-domain-containing protein [Rhodocollybia butyracea]|uniref:Rad17 cell cycle checkpoint protein-domain-containing protein n=1 Tax=Rhodocollybia butyracea TaxID=206335 RepID=A0A9P5U9A2_9AGAR|nr:Rad17 cell cycle checkpoint protein-domain-containing protein [Rhodocollybia butyracea]